MYVPSYIFARHLLSVTLDLAHSPIPENFGYILKHMKMGSDNEFICLIPPARDTPIPAQENLDHDAILSNGWSLLEPLSGKCLYVGHLAYYQSETSLTICLCSTGSRGSLIHTVTIRKSGSSKNSLAHNLAQAVICFQFIDVLITHPYLGAYEPTEDPEVCVILFK
jgi:hypothetical protein